MPPVSDRSPLGQSLLLRFLAGQLGGVRRGDWEQAPSFSLRITLLIPSHHLCLFSFILTISSGFTPSCFYTSFSLAGLGILLPSSPRGPPSHNSGLLSGTFPCPSASRGPEAPFLPGLCLVKPLQSPSALSKVLPLLTTQSPAGSWQLLGSYSSSSSSCAPLLVPPGRGGESGPGRKWFGLWIRQEAMGIAKDH